LIGIKAHVDAPAPSSGGAMPMQPASSSSGPDPSTRAGLPAPDAPSTRREELRSFLFFTVVMAPVLAVVIVAGYGFIVWMMQLVMGPPGA